MARLPLAIVALLLVACGGKTEEERLAALLDTQVVRVYAGARTVVVGRSNDPALREARQSLAAVLTGQQTGATPDVQLARTGTLLIGLATVGAHPRAEDDGALVPALLTLLAPAARMPPGYGVDEDHAFVGAAFWVLKAHPDAPGVPHMDLFSLWEVTRLGERALAKSPMRAVARVVRAIQFADHDLCRMAATETAALRAPGTSARDALALVGAPGRSGAEVAKLDRTLQAGASGMTAVCFLQRGDRAGALPHFEALAADAEAVGLPPREAGVLRAYVSFEKGDVPGAIRALETVRRDPSLSAADQAEVDRLLGYLRTRSDEQFVSAVTDRAMLARLVLGMLFRWADESGVDEAVRRTPAAQAIARFADRVARTVPSLEVPGGLGKKAEELKKRIGQ